MSHTRRIRRTGARTAVGIALAATMLTTAGVAAQSPSTTSPDTASAPSRTIERPDMRVSTRVGPVAASGAPASDGPVSRAIARVDR
jgi:hypothetical protein